MNVKKGIWMVIAVVVLLSALVSGFIFMQPSEKDILVDMLATIETVSDAHAVVEVRVDSPDKDGFAAVEVWGRHSESDHGAFRLQVLDASEAKAAGAVIVSDGETLWAYSPAEGKVLVGTVEEAKAMMEDKEFEMGAFAPQGFKDRDYKDGEFEHPESAEEAVQMLLEYFTADSLGVEDVAGGSAQRLKLSPIPEQMPTEFMAIGGYLNLWIDKGQNIPVALEYTGGSMGEFSATVIRFEINAGVDESLFTFDIPEGVEVISFADLQPQSLSLDEAAASAEFALLAPDKTPAGATLVDIIEISGTIVQRYTLPDGGSFTIAQGASDASPAPDVGEQAVEVRGVSGKLYVAEDGAQVLLAWSDGDLFYYVAGDLSPEQVLAIAESLN